MALAHCCGKRKSATVSDVESGKKGVAGHSARLRLWRCLTERRTTSFVLLLRDATDLDAPRPAIVPRPCVDLCPGKGCRDGETLLIRACCLRATEEAKALLERGADPNRPCADGYAPVQHCARAGAVGCLRALLADPRTDPNAQCPEGMDALHVCAYDPSWKIKDKDSRLECIKLLLQHPAFLPNKVNKWGHTPLINALLRYYEDRVKVMLEYGKSRIDLDWRMFSGHSLRSIIESKFPKIVAVMPPRHLENPQSQNANIRLLALLQHKDLHAFKAMLAKGHVKLNHFYDDPYYCTIIEVACRIPGYENFVDALLDAGADPNTVNKFDKSPLIHQAAECANHKALSLLLAQGSVDICVRNGYQETVLHVATQAISPTEEKVKAMESTVHLLLDYRQDDGDWKAPGDALGGAPGVDVNARDEGGDTPLHNAAIFGLDALVQLLLRRGAKLTQRNEAGDPPLAYLSEDTLRAHLDEQIDSNGLSPQSEMFELIFRYDSLVSTQSDDDDLAEMRSMNFIKNNKELTSVLRHPLIHTFLYLKWNNVKTLFMYNLFLYLLFVLCLTTYSVLINVDFGSKQNISCSPQKPIVNLNGTPGDWKNDYPRGGDIETSTMTSSTEIPVDNVTKCELEESDLEEEAHVIIVGLRSLLSIFLLAILLREGSQLIIEGQKYFLSLENIMELLLVSGTAIIIFSPFLNDTWDRHICGVVILLAWTELILISGRLPFLSIQLEMFKKVSITFVKFMAWYSLIILAFAFSFFVLFNGDSPFYLNPGMSIVKTVIMLAGEFEASELEFSNAPVTSHIIFLFFVCLIAIVLLNLLNGLAVYDTQAIKDDATVLSLVSMVRIVNYIEEFLHKLLKFCRKCKLQSIASRLKNRLRLFDPSISKKQIHVFPGTGEIRFLLDIETTKKFDKYRVSKSILDTSTDIVINRNQETELQKIQNTISEFSDKLNAIEEILKNINLSIGK